MNESFRFSIAKFYVTNEPKKELIKYVSLIRYEYCSHFMVCIRPQNTEIWKQKLFFFLSFSWHFYLDPNISFSVILFTSVLFLIDNWVCIWFRCLEHNCAEQRDIFVRELQNDKNCQFSIWIIFFSLYALDNRIEQKHIQIP